MYLPRKIATATALWILFAAGAAPAQEGPKIAVVDMQKALDDSIAGKKAVASLRKLSEERSGSLQKQKEILEKKKEELDKQGLLLNEDTRKAREGEIRTLERDFSRTLSDIKEELGRRSSEFTEGISKNLLKILEKIGKEGGYTLILDKNGSRVLYSPAAIDLTEMLIKRYDAEGEK